MKLAPRKRGSGAEFAFSERELQLLKRVVVRFGSLAGADEPDVKWFCTAMKRQFKNYEEGRKP